jgi:hypothetical protein
LDQKLVRIYYGDELVASHPRVAAGQFAPEPESRRSLGARKPISQNFSVDASEWVLRFALGPMPPTKSVEFELSA